MKTNLFLLAFLLVLSSCYTKRENKTFNEIKSFELKEIQLYAGKLIRVDSFPSKHITPRPVDVWLPENYSKDKKYAVLYMHDGQMLFDANTTWNKQEWMVDEVASKLMKEEATKDFIVVAIHNISEIRWLDLFPEKAINYLSQEQLKEIQSISNNEIKLSDLKGDEYLSFLVSELKPYIDNTYSVLTNQQNTFVAGSSMGGLMSMYAISEYPTVFGGAACISTHWVGAMPKKDNPFPDAIFKYVADHIPDANNHKLYFDYGNKTLDQFYPQYASRVDSIYLKNSYSDSNYKNVFYPDTDHSENSWQKRLDVPISFILGK